MNFQPFSLGQIEQFLSQGFKTDPATLSHLKATAHVLGLQKAPYIFYDVDMQLKNAIIVCLDMEWYESGPKKVTELGISVLPYQEGPFNKPIYAISQMNVHHMRLKENAHMVNGEKCPGHPENFQFGPTSFVDATQAQQALRDCFLHGAPNGQLRPVVLIGHAIDNDIEVLREHFGFDLASLGVIVMTLDTQIMAKELGMFGGRPMSLKNILGQYLVEEKYLHNAGNDAAQTMVAASLLAGDYATRKGRYEAFNQADVLNLKASLRNRNLVYWGIAKFCTNCEGTDHLVGQCPNKYFCPRCDSSAVWKENAATHPLEKCIRPAVPCQACMQSPDENRHRISMTHYIEDCSFEKGKFGLFIPPQNFPSRGGPSQNAPP